MLFKTRLLLNVFQNSVGSTEDFFLFGCLMEANMIDRRLAEGTIRFELSIGNFSESITLLDEIYDW